MKRRIKRIILLLFLLVAVLGIYVGYVFKTYYRLPDNLTLEVSRNGANTYFDDDFSVTTGRAYMIMTYNIGFGAYRKDFSFFSYWLQIWYVFFISVGTVPREAFFRRIPCFSGCARV